MFSKLNKDRSQEGRFGVLVAFKHPAVEREANNVIILPFPGTEISLEHLHDAGFSATPVAEDAYSDRKQALICNHGPYQIGVHPKTEEILICFVVRPNMNCPVTWSKYSNASAHRNLILKTHVTPRRTRRAKSQPTQEQNEHQSDSFDTPLACGQQVFLAVDAYAFGYPTGLWATYKQWQDLGAQVKKGEKAALVVFWKFSDLETEDEASEGGEREDHSHRAVLARGYSVFNAAQVDGYQAPAVPTIPQAQRIESAESFFGALGADHRHGGGRAYYSPSSDHIQMPNFEVFKDPVAYYAVLAHESTHWTGAPQRLNRDLSGRFGTHSYAAEGLVAELGAAFLCAALGLCNEPRQDHAAYLSSWHQVLKSDKKAIFTAASKAQAAADWMQARQPEEEERAAA